MEDLLSALAAAADPTRLRLLALAAAGSFCVNDFCDILGQSQPRLSRHLRLLCEARLLQRAREGSNAWFTLAPGDMGLFVHDLLRRAPDADPQLAADRRRAAQVLAERARIASETFRRAGADWDEMRALDLSAPIVERQIQGLLPHGRLGRTLDIGTGTGRLLEVLAPRIDAGLGVDASRTMLALARVRLANARLSHCTVRLADMYALPLADRSFDTVLLQMVLHYAEEPINVLAEAARVLSPGGMLLIADLASHDRSELRTLMAHRTLGFSDEEMGHLLDQAGLRARVSAAIDGPLTVRIWTATAACALHDEARSHHEVHA